MQYLDMSFVAYSEKPRLEQRIWSCLNIHNMRFRHSDLLHYMRDIGLHCLEILIKQIWEKICNRNWTLSSYLRRFKKGETYSLQCTANLDPIAMLY